MPEQLDLIDGWVKVTDPDTEFDWVITEKNSTSWHRIFFTPSETKLHQAKGSCSMIMKVIEYMEEQGWLKKGDVILDPMCGIASFLRMAALKGYDCMGIELEQSFIDVMEGIDHKTVHSFKFRTEGGLEKFRSVTKGLKNIGQIIISQGDARELEKVIPPMYFDCMPPEFEYGKSKVATICSPPYGNRLTDVGQQMGSKSVETWQERDEKAAKAGYAQYSQDSDNIGNSKIATICSPPYGMGEHSQKKIDSLPTEQDGKRFTHGMKPHTYVHPDNIAILKDNKYSREMLKVYKSLYNVLGEGSYVALVTKDFIQNGKVIQLHKETIRLMEEAGFCFIEHKKAKLPEVSFMLRINWVKFHKDKGLPLICWEDITFYKKGTV